METETTGNESETKENVQDMFAVYHAPQEIGELPPMGEFRNIDKTMIKTEFMGEKGRGGYENFHLH